MNPYTPYRRDPALRAAALLMVLFGATVCGFGPYASVLAVRVFDLGDRGFAAILVVSTVLSLAAAVWVGIRADQTANRKGMALASLGLMSAGLVLMTVAPGWLSFVLVHAVVLPLASTFLGQLFALARLAASVHPAGERDAIMSTLRALFAAPFVLVLPAWAFAIGKGTPLLTIYPVGLVLAGLMLAITLRLWPRDGSAGWQDPPSGLSFRRALAELGRPGLPLRLAALGAISCATTIYVAVLGLILGPEAGRGPADVALYFGLVAGAEVPFMLMMPLLVNRAPRTVLILIGTAVYVLQIAFLPLLAPTAWLWLLVLPGALGGAVILTLPIAYMQDMMADRPGTSAALMSLQRVAGDVMAAGCFAVGTALSGYGLVAALGTAVALGGAVVLHLADRRRDRGLGSALPLGG